MAYAGPIKKHDYAALKGTRCIRLYGYDKHDTPILCAKPTINGEWWCYGCKDKGGYAEKLKASMQEAKQRLKEAYPPQAWEQPSLLEGM